METLVVSDELSPRQRALLFEWQAEGYFLAFMGLLLGVGIGLNLLPLTAIVCLLLLAPVTLSALALRLRSYRLACGSSMISACAQGMMVFYLFPLLKGPGAVESVHDVLLILAVYPALV